MPQAHQTGSSQNGASNLGYDLSSIATRINSYQPLDSRSERALNDATNHHDIKVSKRAFGLIEFLTDKKPFSATLIKHASDHRKSERADYAYRAMSGAQDLRPFHQVIETGALSPSFGIVCAALTPIGAQAKLHHSIGPELQQAVLSAIQFPGAYVVCQACSIIKELPDKQPYIPALLKHASGLSLANPMGSSSIVAAYGAMSGTNDLSPFHQVIEQGTRSSEWQVAYAAISLVLDQAQSNRSIDPQLEQAVKNAIDHSDDKVVWLGVGTVEMLPDTCPYISSLQKHLTNTIRPQLAEKVAALLNGTRSVPSSLSGAPVVAQKATQSASIVNVRLDFNIEANGGGENVHNNDALRALCAMFDKSTAGGVVTIKAKVFYAPAGKPGQNEIIGVTFPEKDKQRVLGLLAQGVAPEFDLQMQGNSVYDATLTKDPSP